jgi:hypothetical protein
MRGWVGDCANQGLPAAGAGHPKARRHPAARLCRHARPRVRAPLTALSRARLQSAGLDAGRSQGAARDARHRPRRVHPAFRLRHGQRRHPRRHGALNQETPNRARCVVAVTMEISDEELGRLDGLGVRGVRLNTDNKGGMPIAMSQIPELAARIAAFGWHIEFLFPGNDIVELMPVLAELKIPITLRRQRSGVRIPSGAPVSPGGPFRTPGYVSSRRRGEHFWSAAADAMWPFAARARLPRVV